jgi:hypothetical protein
MRNKNSNIKFDIVKIFYIINISLIIMNNMGLIQYIKELFSNNSSKYLDNDAVIKLLVDLKVNKTTIEQIARKLGVILEANSSLVSDQWYNSMINSLENIRQNKTESTQTTTEQDQIKNNGYVTIKQMRNIMREMGCPQGFRDEIANEISKKYDAIQEAKKQIAATNAEDLSNGRMQLVDIKQTKEQENRIKEKDKQLEEKDKEIKKLLDEKKQKDEAAKVISKTAAQIARENGIKGNRDKSSLEELVDAKIAPLIEDNKIIKEDNRIIKADNNLFKDKLTTIIPITNELRITATSNRDKAIQYINKEIQSKKTLLQKQERRAEAHYNKQMENITKLGIENETLKSEVRNNKFTKQIKEQYGVKTKPDYEAKILEFTNKISEYHEDISKMNEEFRTLADKVNYEISILEKDKQSLLDRKIISEEELIAILNPLQGKINLVGLGIQASQNNQPRTSQHQI